MPGLRRGYLAGRFRAWRLGSVPADAWPQAGYLAGRAGSGGGIRPGGRLASGGGTQPVGSGPGGGVPSRRTSGLWRGQLAGWHGSGGGTPSRPSPDLRPGAPSRLARVWWWGSVSADVWPLVGTPGAGWFRARRRDSVPADAWPPAGAPNPSVPGPTAGLRSGGRGVQGRRSPSELSRTESPAPARRSSAGPGVRVRRDRGHRTPAGDGGRLVGPVPEAPAPAPVPAAVGMDTQTPFSSSSSRGPGPAPSQAEPSATP